MKVPLSWIKDYLEIPESAFELSEILTFAGIEVEGIENSSSDPVLECGLTPNLGHCLSILGIARELSALLNRPLHQIGNKEKIWSSYKTSDHLSVQVENSKECDLYGCMVIEGVSSFSPPSWLIDRIEACGIRSVSPLVDLGNYVMLELGQPVHLFDLDRLSSSTLSIETLKEKEEVWLLQGDAPRFLVPPLLIVREGSEIGAVAGVIGATKSSVSETTDRIVVEAAHFHPSSVRAAAKKLRISTESSLRFERGTDPHAVKLALERVASLLEEYGKVKVFQPLYTIEGKEEKWKIPSSSIITLHPDKANRLLGLTLSPAEMIAIFSRLEIFLSQEREHQLDFYIPSYRNDLHIEIDLIEEIARIFGFKHIPRSDAKHVSSSLPDDPLYEFEEEVRTILAGQGLQECLTCDLISPFLANMTMERAMGAQNQIHVLYPASEDQSVLRTSLLPGLLNMVKFNLDRQTKDIAAFEVGHLYFRADDRYIQETAAGIILTGRQKPYHYEEKEEEVDFFHLKGYVENSLASLGIEGVLFDVSHLHNFHPGRQAVLLLEKERIGALGEIHPSHVRAIGIDQRVYYAELNLHVLLRHRKKCASIVSVPLYPGSSRDWTVTMGIHTPVGAFLQKISEINSPLLEKVFLLDLYKSDKIGEDKKNVTFRFQYRDVTHTISYQEVEEEHRRILKIVEQSSLCKEV